MASILFLSDKDFNIQDGKKGKVLCLKQQSGVTFCLFHSDQCTHCNLLYPVFKQLPKIIPNCSFALLNVSKYMNVVKASMDTISQITEVPYMILFVNGRPFMRYTGQRTLEEIESFIQDILSRFRSKKNFSIAGVKGNTIENEVKGPVGFGIPYNMVCDKDVCYLTLQEIKKN